MYTGMRLVLIVKCSGGALSNNGLNAACACGQPYWKLRPPGWKLSEHPEYFAEPRSCASLNGGEEGGETRQKRQHPTYSVFICVPCSPRLD